MDLRISAWERLSLAGVGGRVYRPNSSPRGTNPDFSSLVYCAAAIIRPGCVTLGRPPRRTVKVRLRWPRSQALPGRPLQRLATTSDEKSGLSPTLGSKPRGSIGCRIEFDSSLLTFVVGLLTFVVGGLQAAVGRATLDRYTSAWRPKPRQRPTLPPST